MSNSIIRGLGYAHIAVASNDFEKSLAFYKALGMNVYTEWGEGDKHIALLDSLAGLALTAGVTVLGIKTVYGLGKYLGTAGLTGATGSREQISVKNLAGTKLVFQNIGDMLLTHNVGKVFRTVFTV